MHVLRDLKSVPQVMSGLMLSARRHRVVLTSSSRPYLADYAHELAQRLPGTWTARIEIYAHPVWQADWMDLLWDSGQLGEAMEHRRVPYGAVLSNGAGTELLLIERPGGTDGYLLGACASSDFDDNYQNPFAPRSATLPSSSHRAAVQVATEFLPSYELALHMCLLAVVEAGHDRLQELHADRYGEVEEASRSDDDTATVQSRLVRVVAQYDEESANVFRRLRPHAAHLLDRTRTAVAPGSEDGAALDRLGSLLNLAQNVPAPRPSAFTPPQRLVPASADEVRRWCADAPVLLKHARTALPTAPTAGSPRALDSPPRALDSPPRALAAPGPGPLRRR
ncbi:hypothetical protein ACGFYZ_14295 [Streptomyces sp. NPDC048330]|uniref:hypothetical protein n=1 Tax=Streptomyces sp. NPDC048330 TaxID=3365533 RepID=UPI003720E1F3